MQVKVGKLSYRDLHINRNIMLGLNNSLILFYLTI